ncbi:hypothetical protein M2459_001778 [Parabacteroides sp. PF5-5]|uniref:hypothetical protein n=1 Tax=unclassified Parabacteroides TaxID=2649774 RepID=UPI002473B801|nr:MULTISPECIES: hypothetical protein [unclassified Parabacteroides]MDH6305041.1 hypothetical protein [Parabacteroides sp. PH5-39]MDH6315874.1 hypothetical protein [Parabacteroides sp. PF5-13]MDH6319531.1 hypothetical protein [Parabacteroides sp. PH5-13]MDH6323262.1 hypothetical protein [Parabacteroides sp. PH5-8]MDH6327230.1 hypothetical protein [Parabacteroides sp. PH5-41]
MKKIINILFAALLLVNFSSCDPQEDGLKNLGNVVAAGDIKVSVTPDTSDPNLFHFALTTPNCVGIFTCPEASINKTGVLEFSQSISWANNYVLNVQVYNKAGISEAVQIPFTVTETDPSICENKLFKLLTGGCDAPNGKTWRIKGEVEGHVGCGEEGSSTNNWWNPAPFELNSALYDDDITFILNPEQQMVLDNKGASLMNESTASLFPDGDSSGSFVTTHYKPSTDAGWAITTENGENWLVLSNAFPAYAVNEGAVTNGRYKIVSLTETDMHIVFLPGGISWHYLLTSSPR